MAGAINSLADLVTLLQAAVTGDRIVFDGALLAEAGALAALIDPGNPSFTVTKGSGPLVDPGTTSVVVGGAAPLFAAIDYTVAITGTVPSPGVVDFAMTMTPVDGNWTFRANFPSGAAYFPGYRGYSPAQRKMADQPSFFNDIGIKPKDATAPVFLAAVGGSAPGLTLDALLDVTVGDLGTHVGKFLPTGTALPITGTIVWGGQSFPYLDFAASPGSLGIGKISDIGLQLAAGDPEAAMQASTAQFCGTLQIGSMPPLTACASVLAGPFSWKFVASVADPQRYTLAAGVGALVQWVGGTDLTLPTGLSTIGGFYIASATVGVAPQSGAFPVNALGVTIATASLWPLPLTGLVVDDVAVVWTVVNPFGNPALMGGVSGALYFGPSSDPATPRMFVDTVLTGLTGPDADSVTVSATLDPTRPLGLDVLFSSLTGLDIGIGESITIVTLAIEADTNPRAYSLSAELENSWQPLAPLTLNSLGFDFDYTAGSWSASVTALVGVSNLTFQLAADYRGAGNGWRFEGGLAPGRGAYTLGGFLADILPSGRSVPSDFDTIALTGLSGWFDTKSGESGFDTSVAWNKTFFGNYNLTADAEFSLQRLKDPTTGQLTPSGFLSGDLMVNALRVGVRYNFGIATQSKVGKGASEAQYQFVITYQGTTLTAFLTTNAENQQVLTVNLGGVSFGDIVGFLVDLADPGANFRLSSPWDVLYQINFDALTLSINTVTRAVGVQYAANLNLGFVDIETIGLTYVNQAGVSGVQLEITGNFAGDSYDADNPLGWDLLNDPPPVPAGKGTAALDLRFVGLGQNIGFAQPASYGSVQSVIAAMEANFPPAGVTGPGPLALANSALAFTGDGNWLIGADFTIAEAVTLQLVFNDPALYGLRVALAGDKVKSLAGLDFEILYKKVTDTIGVYHIDLTLPTAMRTLQFGAVSFTLPPIGLDIYTNGNFYIDFGYPFDMDFSNSATVQAAQFNGAGGFYFGLLDGATSDQVPVVSNGSFAPVIEFGIALTIGLGRSFNEGVIAAGLTVNFAGAVEGVFGWFEPSDRSQPSGLYYRVVGMIELRGHLYGEANFVIVSARLDVLAFARLTLTIQSYAPIQIALSLGVEVSASIKIVFFTIHFSFSATLDFSFAIGSSSPTPWVLGAPPSNPLMLAQQLRGQWRPPTSGAALHRRLSKAIESDAEFDWTPVAVFDGPLPLSLSLAVNLTTGYPAGATAPAVQAAMALYAANSVPSWVRRSRDMRTVEIDAPGETPFNLIATAMLRWALAAYQRPAGLAEGGPSNYALASDFNTILAYLGDSDNWRAAFTYPNLAQFMELNFRYQIGTMQGLSAPTGMSGPPPSAAAFPMIPELGLVGATGPIGWLKDQALIGSDYEDALLAYYNQLKPPSATGASGSSAAAARRPESLSAFMFRDYFAMVVRGAADNARSMLKAYPYRPSGASGPRGSAETLASIAAGFTGPVLAYDTSGWESLGHIAERLGVAVAALRRANPQFDGHDHRLALPHGSVVSVPTAPTPETIGAANPGFPLQTGWSGPGTVPIADVLHQIMATGGIGGAESLGAIAAAYGIVDAGAFFEGPVGQVNGGNAALLRPGATLTVPGASWGGSSGLDITDPASVAGFFVARAAAAPQPSDGLWYELVSRYAQYIQTHTPSLSGPTWAAPLMGWTGPTGPTAPYGTTPIQIGATAYVVQGVTGPTGATLAGPARDTVQLAAAALALRQLQPPPYGDVYAAFSAAITGGAGAIGTPPFLHSIKPGEGPAGLGALYGMDPAALGATNAGATGLLQPLAVLKLPTFEYALQPGDTLGSIATAFDLTVEQVAASLADSPRLLAPWSPTGPSLTIPDLPGRNTAMLIDDLATLGEFNQLSGMVSRFLLHGMRAPSPATGPVGTFPPDVTMAGLLQQAGQQFAVPTGPSGPTGFTLEFASDAGWVGFVAGNPTGPTARLALDIPLSFVAAQSPATTLGLTFAAGPTALPLWSDAPLHYPFGQPVHWQSATPVGLTGPGTGPAGQPSIWPLPAALQAVAAAGATANGPSWGLYAAPQGQPGATGTRILHSGWGTAVDLAIRRVRDTAGNPVANVYLLLGADQDGSDLLRNLWPTLGNPGDQLFLLYAPDATSNNAQGMVSQPLDTADTAILKAGLSTTTHLQGFTAVAAAAGQYYATVDSPADFVQLAWEASITGKGGFYLLYRLPGGADLPASLFAGSDDATLRLVALTAAQGAGGQAMLTPGNNIAVIGENVPAHVQLFATLEDPQPADLHRSAITPPGYAGFYAVRTDPEPEGATRPLTPDDQTRALYQMIGTRIAGNGDFAESNAAMPSGPLDGNSVAVPGPTGPGYWRYRTLLPVYRFGLANSCPASNALPAAADNPYRGIRAPSKQGQFAAAEMPLAFYDVFGNETAYAGDQPVVAASIGYTDGLIGPAGWPGLSSAYAFRAADGGVVLETVFAFQSGRYAPQGSYSFAQANATAIADRAGLTTAFYQLQQPDYWFALSTNMGTLAADPATLKAQLGPLVTKGLVYATASAAQRQRSVVTVAGETLAGIAATWRVDSTALVSENQDQPLAALFKGAVVLPQIAVAGASQSVAQLAAKANLPSGATFPPTCTTGLASSLRRGAGLRLAEAGGATGRSRTAESTSITPLDVATWNATAPLSPGLVLSLPAVNVTLTAPASLDDIAAAQSAVVYATIPGTYGAVAIGLYCDNLDQPAVAAGVRVNVQGVTLISSVGTLADLHAAFVAKLPNLIVPDFVAAIRGTKGLIAAGTIRSGSYVVPPAPAITPASLAPATLAEIVDANQFTPGFFKQGTPLYLGYSCYTPSETDTFATLAADKNVPLDALATYNAGTLRSGVDLVIPDLIYFDCSAPLYASYSPIIADSLASIGNAFGLGPTGYAVVGALTAQLPGIFADGVYVLGPSGLTGATAQPLDSLASMAATLGMEFDAFLAHAAGLTGLYRPGGAFLGPAPQVPGPTWSPPIDALAARFNLAGPEGLSGAALLLDANRALDGFLAPGAALRGPSGSIAIQLHDTVGTILAAMQAQTKAPWGVAELAAANAGVTGLLGVGATFLVPPDPTLIRTPLSVQVPPAGLTEADAITFPVSVSVAAGRDPNWVAPDFAGATGVFLSSIGIGPKGASGPSGQVDLRSFAAAFEQAFAGQQLRAAVSADKTADPAARIWALNLGPSGASGIMVDAADPDFYAIAPLSTALVNGSIDIASYQSCSGLGATASKTFNSVDLDAWMMTFLSAVDLVLGPQYGAGAFAAGETGPQGFAGASHDAFDAIVAAKQQIALGLTGQVMPVLSSVGATGGAALVAARETILQHMLDKLSDAYKIASVIQYSVALTSPCGATGTAPRLSGRLVNDLVPTPADSTLATAASTFGVAPPALALALGNVHGLLRTGAKVAWAGTGSYSIKPNDAIIDVAAGLSQPLRDWDDWTAFAAGIDAQAIFAVGALLPVVRIHREVLAGETAPGIADFFQSDVGGVFQANQTLAGIFPVGIVITVGTEQYPVQAGQSVLDILAANIGWTLADVADWAIATPAPLMAGARLGFVRLLPDIELSSAKLPLTDAASPILSFTVSVSRPAEVRNLFLNLRFVVSEVEYAISDVAAAPGYQASSWLSLINPIGATGAAMVIPQVQVPVPLRFYPTPGSLLSHSGAAMPIPPNLSAAEQIAAGRQWAYSFDLATDTAEQDTIHLDMLFNSGGNEPRGLALADRNAALFAALAQFVDCWPALSQDLARLLADKPSAPDYAAAIAVQVFATLSTRVADALWPSGEAMALGATGPVQHYRYGMSIRTDDLGDLSRLTLADEVGVDEHMWPDVWVQASGPSGATFLPLKMLSSTGPARSYDYPQDIAQVSPLVHRFRFDGLDCLASRDGWAGVSISRNDDLVASGPLGAAPTGPSGPIATSPDFIYQTPVVRFLNPLTPFIERAGPIGIGGLTAPNAPPPALSIAQYLENMFGTVLGPSGAGDVSLAALFSYDRPLTPMGPTATMPVLFMPASSPDDINALAAALGQSLENWWRHSPPPSATGALGIDLTLFAQPAGASGPKPLLEFSALALPVDQIDWDGKASAPQ